MIFHPSEHITSSLDFVLAKGDDFSDLTHLPIRIVHRCFGHLKDNYFRVLTALLEMGCHFPLVLGDMPISVNEGVP